MALPGQIADVRLPAANAALGAGDPIYSVNTSSLTATGTLFEVNTDGTGEISVQVTSAGTTCTIVYETSNDRVTWLSAGGADSAALDAIRADIVAKTQALADAIGATAAPAS